MPEIASTLIVPLGSKAQLITLGLDCLRLAGQPPENLLVVHTDVRRTETAAALARLAQDIPQHYPQLNYRTLELAHRGQALCDVTAPDEVEAAFRALYVEVRALKLREERIHLLISGGRRTLTVFGMAVAQMLFDDDDHLWHLASHPVLEQSGNLHAGAGEWAHLIPIPLIPWGRLSPVFDALRAVDDPFEAAERLGRLRLREQWDLARIFILTGLSGAERLVVELLVRDGLNQNEIAERLSLSPRTVEQHLRSAYRKAAEHWGVDAVNQTQLVRLLMPFYRF
jgi:CRISPR-associated protein Csx14